MFNSLGEKYQDKKNQGCTSWFRHTYIIKNREQNVTMTFKGNSQGHSPNSNFRFEGMYEPLITYQILR